MLAVHQVPTCFCGDRTRGLIRACCTPPANGPYKPASFTLCQVVPRGWKQTSNLTPHQPKSTPKTEQHTTKKNSLCTWNRSSSVRDTGGQAMACTQLLGGGQGGGGGQHTGKHVPQMDGRDPLNRQWPRPPTQKRPLEGVHEEEAVEPDSTLHRARATSAGLTSHWRHASRRTHRRRRGGGLGYRDRLGRRSSGAAKRLGAIDFWGGGGLQAKMSWRSPLTSQYRDQGSELSSAAMIPQMTEVADLTRSED